MGLAQRLKKLEAMLGQLKPPEVEAPELEWTDEQWADWMGGFLWEKVAMDMNRGSPSSATFRDGPKRAWHEAALLAWQEGHRAYHVGLRPVAMAVWLDFKPGYFQKCREDRAYARIHGEWVWDVPPRFNQVTTLEEFRRLPQEEQMAALMDPGIGHWSKDAPNRRKR